MEPADGSSLHADWQQFLVNAEQLQRHSSSHGVDSPNVQLALQHVRPSQQLCRLLGLERALPSADACAAADAAADSTVVWPQRAATVAALVQQLLGIHIGDQETDPARVIELLGVHSVLSAAVGFVSGAVSQHTAGVVLGAGPVLILHIPHAGAALCCRLAARDHTLKPCSLCHIPEPLGRCLTAIAFHCPLSRSPAAQCKTGATGGACRGAADGVH